MSPLIGILDFLRYVLEYFGLPADMLLPVCQSKLCGQYRSIVRLIGSNLPLSPRPRVHFQVPFLAHATHGRVGFDLESPTIPSFADVMWVVRNDSETVAKFRSGIHLPSGYGVRHCAAVEVGPERAVALKKITALEEELLRLRAQIAVIVSAPTGLCGTALSNPAGPDMSQNNLEITGTPLPAPLLPVLTSTPRCIPPPPPPPPPPSSNESVNRSEKTSLPAFAIQSQTGDPKQKKNHRSQAAESEARKGPSMLEVLKDLNQVKLRVVERSPGGTPVRLRRRTLGKALPSDPASIIAEALKKKFACRQLEDSLDKENCSSELSPFGSPEVPCIPQHVRREHGRLYL